MKKIKKFIDEFKTFAIKGNMLDLAIAMVIGTSFTAIVKSIVDDVIMPLVGIIIGGRDFTALSINVGEETITYGNLIQNFVNFFVIAMFLFFVVKLLNAFRKKKEEEPAPPKKADDIILLEDIKKLLEEIKDK